MIVTNEMIFKELLGQRKILERILERDLEHSIEEISLNKTVKLLRLSPATILREVKKGNLKARVYRDSKRKKRYRFRIADIREFQENMQEVEFNGSYETVEEMAERIFG